MSNNRHTLYKTKYKTFYYKLTNPSKTTNKQKTLIVERLLVMISPIRKNNYATFYKLIAAAMVTSSCTCLPEMIPVLLDILLYAAQMSPDFAMSISLFNELLAERCLYQLSH